MVESKKEKEGVAMPARTLTQGSITRQLIGLTLPLLLGNLIQQFYNTVDMMIVGQVAGETPFAAIGVAGSLMSLFTCLLIGFNMGCSILFANRFGAQDFDGLRHTLFTTGVILAGVTVLLTGLGLVFLDTLIALIQTPTELRADCRVYLFWILLGLAFTALYNLCATLLQALGKTQVTLLALAVAMVTNIGLDLLFVAVFQLSAAGAALATILAQCLSAVVCLVYLYKTFPQLRLTRRDMVLEKRCILQASSYGSVSALQQSSLYFGKLLVQSTVNAMGAAAVTAFTAASCVDNLILAFGDSGIAALAVFVAQNDGAHCDRRITQGIRQGWRLMMGTSAVLGLLVFVLRGQAMTLLVPEGNAQAVTAACQYLGIMCVCYLLAFWADTNQGYFRGSGHISYAFYVTLLQIGLRVLFTYLLPRELGVTAVAAATGLGWVAMIAAQTLLKRGLTRPRGSVKALETA